MKSKISFLPLQNLKDINVDLRNDETTSDTVQEIGSCQNIDRFIVFNNSIIYHPRFGGGDPKILVDGPLSHL